MNGQHNVQATPFVVDESAFRARMAEFNWRISNSDELRTGIAVSERLIGTNLAPFEVIESIQEATRVATWVTGDPVDGFFLTIPITETGVEALRGGSFTPPSPDPAHVAAKGETAYGLYVGIYAGDSYDARKSVMSAAATLRVEFFGTVPCFARGATADGIRTMHELGFSPVIGSLPNLFVQEALIQPETRAA